MNSPAFPPAIEILVVVLAEFIFGLIYNALVAWADERQIYAPYVAFSVVLGVAVTILIPTIIWWARLFSGWQWGALMLVSFASSGAMMVVGSLKRHADRRTSHKRRAWPTAAAQAREAAVMELSSMAAAIAAGNRRPEDVVHRIHQVIGTLKSV